MKSLSIVVNMSNLYCNICFKVWYLYNKNRSHKSLVPITNYNGKIISAKIMNL